MKNRKPPLIYIAGPYTGKTYMETQANIQRAMEIGAKVVRLGGMPVIPHSNTPLCFTDIQSADFWYEGTRELLSVCQGAVFFEGWHKSTGSVQEKAHADKLLISCILCPIESEDLPRTINVPWLTELPV